MLFASAASIVTAIMATAADGPSAHVMAYGHIMAGWSGVMVLYELISH